MAVGLPAVGRSCRTVMDCKQKVAELAMLANSARHYREKCSSLQGKATAAVMALQEVSRGCKSCWQATCCCSGCHPCCEQVLQTPPPPPPRGGVCEKHHTAAGCRHSKLCCWHVRVPPAAPPACLPALLRKAPRWFQCLLLLPSPQALSSCRQSSPAINHLSSNIMDALCSATTLVSKYGHAGRIDTLLRLEAKSSVDEKFHTLVETLAALAAKGWEQADPSMSQIKRLETKSVRMFNAVASGNNLARCTLRQPQRGEVGAAARPCTAGGGTHPQWLQTVVMSASAGM